MIDLLILLAQIAGALFLVMIIVVLVAVILGVLFGRRGL